MLDHDTSWAHLIRSIPTSFSILSMGPSSKTTKGKQMDEHLHDSKWFLRGDRSVPRWDFEDDGADFSTLADFGLGG